MSWFGYASWYARDEILHFVQDDNLLVGWRMDTLLARPTTQNDNAIPGTPSIDFASALAIA